jgi:Cu/Ag efflux protein CusF
MKVMAQGSLAVVLGVAVTAPLQAQAAQTLPHEAGTVKSTSGDGFVLTTAAGQSIAVSVPAGAKVLIVPPGARSLSAATPGTAADVQPGDRALVTGTEGDTATALHAERVILMKSTAIAQTHEAEEAEWAKGGGGIVKTVDAADGKITISSGLGTLTIMTGPSTIVRRYAGDSVRFADARPSTITAINPGDQLRVRGTRSANGSTITADEVVTGTFHNYSGLLTAVDPAAGTVTLKDLATKKVVTVEVTPNSDVRRLPPMAARMIAMRMHGGAAGNGAARHEGTDARGEAAGAEGESGTRRAGMDLSQMLSRLPAETLAGLKTGDAVMIVATSPSGESEHNSAVTLLVGVEPILTAPSGESMTISPWSVGSEPDTGMGGEGGAGPGR